MTSRHLDICPGVWLESLSSWTAGPWLLMAPTAGLPAAPTRGCRTQPHGSERSLLGPVSLLWDSFPLVCLPPCSLGHPPSTKIYSNHSPVRSPQGLSMVHQPNLPMSSLLCFPPQPALTACPSVQVADTSDSCFSPNTIFSVPVWPGTCSPNLIPFLEVPPPPAWTCPNAIPSKGTSLSPPHRAGHWGHTLTRCGTVGGSAIADSHHLLSLHW